MARVSGYLKRQQEQKERVLEMHRRFTMQWCLDAAILAANEVFRRKGEKLVEFVEVYSKYANEIAKMTMEDAKDDKALDYTKGTIDARMQELLGDAFQPWDERYDFGGKKV